MTGVGNFVRMLAAEKKPPLCRHFRHRSSRTLTPISVYLGKSNRDARGPHGSVCGKTSRLFKVPRRDLNCNSIPGVGPQMSRTLLAYLPLNWGQAHPPSNSRPWSGWPRSMTTAAPKVIPGTSARTGQSPTRLVPSCGRCHSNTALPMKDFYIHLKARGKLPK